MPMTDALSSTTTVSGLFQTALKTLPANSVEKQEIFIHQSSHSSAIQKIDFTSEILLIMVGREQHVFHVHEKLISSRSAFVRTAMKTDKFGRNGPEPPALLFEESNKDTFSDYVNLSYTGRVQISKPSKLGIWPGLIDLYVLAEKLCDPWAKDRTIEAMYSFIEGEFNSLPSVLGIPWIITFPAPIAKLYSGTKAGNQGRALLAYVYARRCTSGHFAFGNREWPKDFVCDIVVHLIDQRLPVSTDKVLERPVSQFYESCFEVDTEGKLVTTAQALVDSTANLSLHKTKA